MRISDWSSDVCSSDLLTVGDGFADKVAQGPLIDDAAIAKVKEHVKDALDKGAKVTVGGKAHELGGRFFQPTVLSNVREDILRSEERRVGKEWVRTGRTRCAAFHLKKKDKNMHK